MKQRPYALQVLIASGPEALDRAVLGFALALSATTCGAEVSVILTLRGIAWANKDLPEAHRTVNGFSSIAEYMNMLAESGDVVRLCSSCAQQGCAMDDTAKAPSQNLPYTGLVEVAMHAVQGAATTVVF